MTKKKLEPIDSMTPFSERTFTQLQILVLAILTAIGIYVCYRLLNPFVPAIAWALALSVLFTPFQLWLETKLKHPSTAAVISVASIALIAVILTIFVGQRLALQVESGAVLVDEKVSSGEWRQSLEAQPYLAPIIIRFEQGFDLPGTIKSISSWLTSFAGSIVRGSVYQVLGFCLTFYLLFFFLRDRREILRSIRSLSPLSDVETNHIFQHIGDTIYATIYGTIAVSSVQGLLGGLMFWWLGLPASFLWGVVMGLLAIVPVLGAFIVWAPAALFLVLEGSLGKAVILALWGIFVVGTVDNFLRPVLVGNRLKLHTLLVFISLVGGIILFGAAGLILGPVSATITIGLLKIWSNQICADPKE